MTEEQFYKLKIFEKAGIEQLRTQFPHLVTQINAWYRSDRYLVVQSYKLFLANKLQQMAEDGQPIVFTSDQVYALFTWWEVTPKQCYYCWLEEADLLILDDQPGHINKRNKTRGKSLEIDRKNANLPYTDIDNLALACYWCNNAKTDTFTAAEFMPIGAQIRKVWERRLGKLLLPLDVVG